MERKNKIYIAGHNGMVGSSLVRKFIKEGFESIITASSSKLDLRNQQMVNSFFDFAFVEESILGIHWFALD